jgi:alkylation response protein AidB-like acyl-CoA dehydrogenase
VSWGLGGGNSIGFPPILNYGTVSLKRKLLPGIINGSIRVCLGITEPNAGSDVAGIRTTANLSPDGKHYIVNGQKKWYVLNPWSSFYPVRPRNPFLVWRVADRRITNGIWADYVTAAVRTRGLETGAAGISVLIIPLRGKGVKRRKLWNSGVHASGSTFIEFDDVEVPVSHLLGKENQGFQIIMSSTFPLLLLYLFLHLYIFLYTVLIELQTSMRNV